jgi:hypothetical protein
LALRWWWYCKSNYSEEEPEMDIKERLDDEAKRASERGFLWDASAQIRWWAWYEDWSAEQLEEGLLLAET